jgi:hypothetical protein
MYAHNGVIGAWIYPRPKSFYDFKYRINRKFQIERSIVQVYFEILLFFLDLYWILNTKPVRLNGKPKI